MRTSSSHRPAATTSNTLRFGFGDIAVESKVTVPSARVDAQDVLPALQGMVNDVVSACERHEAAAGRTISCRKGCGACCRQLVPVAPVEARAIADLVRSLPPARRAAVEERFAAARSRLAEDGLLEALASPAGRSSEAEHGLGQRYFALGIACPFLEDEACSIHQQRPLACREYLVTSPAERCAQSGQPGVSPVAVPKLAVAARGMDAQDGVADITGRWVPLALATSWAAANRPSLQRRTGPDWFQRFLSRLQLPPGRRSS